MIILPFYAYGLYLALEQDAGDYAAYFIILIVVTLLGVWDAINS